MKPGDWKPGGPQLENPMDQVGFLVVVDRGQVEFHGSIDPPGVRLVAWAETPNTSVVWLGRLAYRGEWPEKLGRTAAEVRRWNDARLAAEVYEQLGLDGLNRLEGIFCGVLFDRPARRLLALRDPMGGFPLFWSASQDTAPGSTKILGTSFDHVRRRAGVDQLDPLGAAQRLTPSSMIEHEPPGDRTMIVGVQRLAAVDRLVWPLDAQRPIVERRWNWLDETIAPAGLDLPTAAAQYKTLLSQAVETFLDPAADASVGLPVGVHLSGGMDSTAIAFLAHQAAEQGRAPAALHTLSVVHDQIKVLRGERSIIEACTAQGPRFQPHFLPGDDLWSFRLSVDPPPHDQPWALMSLAENERRRVDEAAALGLQVVLSGQGADELIDLPPYDLADQLRAGRWLSAWRQASAAARAETCSPWTVLRPFGLAPWFPAPRGKSTTADPLALTFHDRPDWITPAFADQVDWWDLTAANHRRTFHDAPTVLLSVALSKIAARTGDPSRWALSAPRGVLAVHPFLDSRVLRFCLGLYACRGPFPRDQPKPLLSTAMLGVLPEQVRTRRKSTFFDELYYRGLSRALPDLERLVRSTPLDALPFLDPDLFLVSLRRHALGVPAAEPFSTRLNQTLSLLVWLRSTLSASPPPAFPLLAQYPSSAH